MTRTDGVASSRPQTKGAASMGVGSSGARRRLLALPVLLVVAALAAPTAAYAAGEAGYATTPSTPTTPTTPTTTTTTTTTTSKAPEPKAGTSPAKEVSPSKTATTPAKTTTTTPTTTTEAAKAQTLPFTGLDLRWVLAIGVVLMGAGLSMLALQRRQRRGNSSR
jgi:cytoskeletal protein RodZ